MAINQQRRISHDALYNLHEIAYDLPDFMWTIQTFPDLTYVCGMKDILDQLDRLLLIESQAKQLLSYDTTFKLGDFYVSPLIFRHTIFKEAPVIPALFLIHERKFQITHEMLFEIAAMKAITKSSFSIVTDEEKGIVNAIRKYLPNSTRLRCWNHIFRSARYWCHSHKIKNNEIQVFVSGMKDLFHKHSSDAYEAELNQRTVNWSNQIHQYYFKNIHPEVYTSIGRWILEKEGVYCPFSGVVTNQSASFNMVLKSLQSWKEVPVDCIVLSFYILQSFFMNEITRGLANQGNYHLHTQFLHMMEEAVISEATFICVSPQDIVNRIREKDTIVTSADDFLLSGQQEVKVENHKPHSSLTQIERARIILESGNISFDPKLHLFNVIGSGDRPYVVRLFPREMCSCPSSEMCYHLIAVKISIGSEIDVTKHRKFNLTMFRKRTRNRKDKTSGRKRARKMDVDESHLENDIPSYFLSEPNSENISSHNSTTQVRDRLVDYSSDNFSLYSISPVNSQDSKQKEGSSPNSHSLILDDFITENSSNGNNNVTLNLTSKQGTEVQASTLQYECKKNELARHLLFFHKQKKSYILNDATVIEIDESNVEQDPCREKEYWLKRYTLLQGHKHILLSGGWLDDKLVDASQKILAKQFENKFVGSGFQDAAVGLCGNFTIETGEFIQIIHGGSNHWLTISTIGTKHPEVLLYDSLHTNVAEDVKMQISSILCTKEKSIILKFVNIVKQAGVNDCGLFAIAYATALCLGKSPGKYRFKQELFRKHLQTCLEREHFTMFPIIIERRKGDIISMERNICVFCYCRMPQINPMIQWSTESWEWFHIGPCVSITDAQMKDKNFKWHCRRCTTV